MNNSGNKKEDEKNPKISQKAENLSQKLKFEIYYSVFDSFEQLKEKWKFAMHELTCIQAKNSENITSRWDMYLVLIYTEKLVGDKLIINSKDYYEIVQSKYCCRKKIIFADKSEIEKEGIEKIIEREAFPKLNISEFNSTKPDVSLILNKLNSKFNNDGKILSILNEELFTKNLMFKSINLVIDKLISEDKVDEK